jgi:hypothetical protein
LVFAPKGE